MENAVDGRFQIEQQLETLRNVAEQRQASRIRRWLYRVPALISIGIFLPQIINTGILFSYSENFDMLHDLLENYINETDNISNDNLTNMDSWQHEHSLIEERFLDVDVYCEQLWALFITEVIQLIIPIFNIIAFAWHFITKRKFGKKMKTVYLMTPILALLLSLSQACMIEVSLAGRVHAVRFILAKIISPLLEYNLNGSAPIEMAFNCVFQDETSIEIPSCSSVLHDNVLSTTILDVLIVLHIVPLVIFSYIVIRNFAEGQAEHLFLCVQNLEQQLDKNSQSQRVSRFHSFDDGKFGTHPENSDEKASIEDVRHVVERLMKEYGGVESSKSGNVSLAVTPGSNC